MRIEPRIQKFLAFFSGAFGVMAKPSVLILAASMFLVGCMRYDVCLTNRATYINVSRKYNPTNDTYTLKTMSGKTIIVRNSQIKMIEPHESEKARSKDGTAVYFR